MSNVSDVDVPHRPTLWEKGRFAAPGVVLAATSVTLLAALLDLALVDRLGWAFDVVFVIACTGSALAVRRSAFYTVSLLPPVLMLLVVTIAVAQTPDTVARPGDSVVQAFVTVLAHHADALVGGYALTVLVIALRVIALRHAGMLRVADRPSAPNPDPPPDIASTPTGSASTS